MAFEIRPNAMPRTIPFGRNNFGLQAPTPTYRQRGVAFDVKKASPETTADNPSNFGPSGYYAPAAPDSADRKTTIEDIYSLYDQYLGRTPEFGVEVGGAAEGSAPGTGTTGRIGNSFNSVVNQFRNSQEFKDRLAKGIAPKNKNPYTGQPGTGGWSAYAKGGTIREPVVGRGTRSGRKYLLGEDGPERVTPIKHPPRKGPVGPMGPKRASAPNFPSYNRTPYEQEVLLGQNRDRAANAQKVFQTSRGAVGPVGPAGPLYFPPATGGRRM